MKWTISAGGFVALALALLPENSKAYSGFMGSQSNLRQGRAVSGKPTLVMEVSELELELIRSQMTQKPQLRGEVGACAWRVCGQTREEVWASAGGARRLGELACVVKL